MDCSSFDDLALNLKFGEMNNLSYSNYALSFSEDNSDNETSNDVSPGRRDRFETENEEN